LGRTNAKGSARACRNDGSALDAREGALAGLLHRVRPDDVGVDGGVAGAHEEEPLEGGLHVARLDVAVRGRPEPDALAQREAQGAAAVAHLRQVAGDVRHDLGAPRAGHAPQREEPVAGVGEDLPALRRVREPRVEEVGVPLRCDRQRAALGGAAERGHAEKERRRRHDDAQGPTDRRTS
jgi:hypothetical protein